MARVTSDKNTNFAPQGRFRDIIIRKTRVGLVASRYDEPSEKVKKLMVSKLQSRNREVFKILQKMANPLKEVINVGFKREIVYAAHPRFIHHNYAIIDISDEGILEIDYANMLLSIGTLKTLKDINAVRDGDEIDIRWSTNSMTVNDRYHQVLVAAYCPDCNEQSVITNIDINKQQMSYRKDGQTKVTIPKEWGDSKFHLYVFVYTNGTNSKKANASQTQYVEMATNEL